jgi:hypothetical protein
MPGPQKAVCDVSSYSLECVLLGAMDKCGVNARTAEGRTALSFAVESNPCCLALVKTLLAAGADVDAADSAARR